MGKPEAFAYFDSHPIREGPGNIGYQETPFMAAAHWLAPGLAINDMVMVGGKMPINPDRLATMIENEYMKRVTKMYNDAVAAGGAQLPPREQIFSTDGVVFHTPSYRGGLDEQAEF